MAFRFEHLNVWIDANEYIRNIYDITKRFPKEELFALVSQLRRAATSISANIAEGAGSSSKKDFSHYLDIAVKSIYETVSHLYVAKQQGYITEEKRRELYSQAEVLVKKLKAFQNTLK